jgi:hypothetical protein
MSRVNASFYGSGAMGQHDAIAPGSSPSRFQVLGAADLVFLANEDQKYRCRNNHDCGPQQQTPEKINQRRSHSYPRFLKHEHALNFSDLMAS